MSGTDREHGTDVPVFRMRARQLEKLPPCQAQCPNSGDVRGWVGIIAQHDKNGLTLEQAYDAAWAKIAELNPFPATIGRICPHPCESLCTRADKDGAVSINALERFLGDWGLKRSLRLPRLGPAHYPESVGVIGSGPAGLSFAYQMVRRGYSVTVYEKRHAPGGMLRHAIPEFRLPREVLDAEIKRVLDVGIELVSGTSIGGDISLEALRSRHALVFLGLGAQFGRALGIPGEQGAAVISGIDYLEQRKQRCETRQGMRVLVVGGGNTALDAARSARREGAAVTVVYRRTETEMPATHSEIEDARREGVEFRFLGMPVSIVRDGDAISHIEIQAMQLGEPDDTGRRCPVPVAGRIDRLPADMVIVAVSQQPAWDEIDSLRDYESWLRTTEDGRLDTDLWAGGDDRGLGIASKAIAQGRLAAEAAHARLRGDSLPAPARVRAVAPGSVKSDFYAPRPRTPAHRPPPEQWLKDPELEIDRTITTEEACAEAARCMSCGLCFDCGQCFMYCNPGGFARIDQTEPGKYFALALDACEGCGKCIEVCPSGYLEERDGDASW